MCLPRLSCSRTAPVSCSASPASVLVSVLLPAPDEPSSTTVWPPCRYGASERAAAGCVALTAITSSELEMRSRSSVSRASSSWGRGAAMSALVSTTTGSTPLPCTSAR